MVKTDENAENLTDVKESDLMKLKTTEMTNTSSVGDGKNRTKIEL